MSFEPSSQVPTGPHWESEGIYLSAPFQGRYRLSQTWGENPDRYGQFRIANRPLQGHNGLDFDVPPGSAVLAVTSGEVVEIGEDRAGYGRYVVVVHWWGESVYAHLQTIQVACGAKVDRGQRLGSAGASGFANIPICTWVSGLRPIIVSMAGADIQTRFLFSILPRSSTRHVDLFECLVQTNFFEQMTRGFVLVMVIPFSIIKIE